MSASQVKAHSHAGPGFKARDGWLLLGCVLIVPLIYFPYLWHNLPVAANVDERTSFAILLRFHHGSLNPQFFMYPTLYYYLTYLWVLPFSPAHFLPAGRLLNLCLVGVTAFLTYAFCKRHLDSGAAGLIAAVCVITSTTVTNSGSYLCTDVLLAAATMGSLYYLVEYFGTGRTRPWLCGMVLLGAAVGSKYTAFLLFIAYYLVELILAVLVPEARNHVLSADTRERFSRTAVIGFLLACGAAAALGAGFFPIQAILHFVASNRANADLRDPLEYLRFFEHMRKLLAIAAILCLTLAVAVRFSQRLYAGVSQKRPYLGLSVVLLVSYLATPYSLIDPKRFLYDLGALARVNIVVAGHEAEWAQYLRWLFSNENAILVILSFAGVALIATRARRQLFVAGLYFVLYCLVIGSAHLGYPRYLTPILPLLYSGAGVALVSLWKWKPHATSLTPWVRAVLIVLAVTISIEVVARIVHNRALSRSSDAFISSYQIARLNLAGTDLYAGYAPSVELEAAGAKTRQVSWASLHTGSLGLQINCGDLLILDKKEATLHAVQADADPTVKLLLDDPRGDGQEIVQRKIARS